MFYNKISINNSRLVPFPGSYLQGICRGIFLLRIFFQDVAKKCLCGCKVFLCQQSESNINLSDRNDLVFFFSDCICCRDACFTNMNTCFFFNFGSPRTRTKSHSKQGLLCELLVRVGRMEEIINAYYEGVQDKCRLTIGLRDQDCNCHGTILSVVSSTNLMF